MSTPSWPTSQPVPPGANPRNKHRIRRFLLYTVGGLVALLVLIGVLGAIFGSNKTTNTRTPTTLAAAHNTVRSTAALVRKTVPTTAAPTTAPRPNATTTPPPATSTPAPATTLQTPAGYKASAQNVTVSHLVNDPSIYDGTVVTFTGTIVNFLQDSSGVTTAMNVSDPNDPTSIVYVQLSPTADVTQMNKSDTVTIWGDGQGTASGTNAFGATINVSAVSETYLTNTSTGYSDDSNTSPS